MLIKVFKFMYHMLFQYILTYLILYYLTFYFNNLLKFTKKIYIKIKSNIIIFIIINQSYIIYKHIFLFFK